MTPASSPTPPPPEPERPSGADLRVQIGPATVTLERLKTAQVALIAGCIAGLAWIVPQAIGGLKEVGDAWRDSAATLRTVAEEQHTSRQALGRVENRLDQGLMVIEGRLDSAEREITAVRAELRSTCGPRRVP